MCGECAHGHDTLPTAAPVAQRIEHPPPKRGAASSILAGRAIFRFRAFRRPHWPAARSSSEPQDTMTSGDDVRAKRGPRSAEFGVLAVALVLLEQVFSSSHELMRRWCEITCVAVGVVSTAATIYAQAPRTGRPNFSGAWTLNRDLSDPPPQGAAGTNEQSRGGGAPRGPDGAVPRSQFRAYRGAPDRLPASGAAVPGAIDELIGELRDGSPSLTVSHADPVLTVTDARDRTRLFQTNGQPNPHQIGSATVVSTTRWDGDRLITDYDAGAGRRVRIVYSMTPFTRQLVEQVTLPGGQTIKRVYDPARSIRRR